MRAAQRGGRAEAGAGRSAEGDCIGWKRPARVSSLTHLGYPGPGRLGWLTSPWLLSEITVEPPKGMVKPIVNPLISIFFKGHQTVRRRPWTVSKRRHLDCPNWWCGQHRCSPDLTSLFGK